ncbi:hypothetical protein QFC21_007072 [Naganishia friedmannii]|uniref:Uncharacterized protein n=1 Tax=Naganishia friedmannii TaxID=89922 RepID=A0ACC2UYR2_9TREE|nr:hypothetical protein QFC21_007072 [Naganishia friedmannii]
MSRPPVPGFTAASALPRTTPTEDATMKPKPLPTTSNRNASNAHLPMPSAPPIGLPVEHNNEGETMAVSSGATVGLDGKAAPAPGTNVNGVEGGPAAKAQDKTNKPVNVPSGSKRSIVVNARQRGNPVLKAIHGVGWEYGDIIPDYQVGANTCVLYLSLKYHRLHPEYLHTRIESIRGMYLLRVLLIMCDIVSSPVLISRVLGHRGAVIIVSQSEHQEPIREITKICLINEITVITAWSNEEAATYLATYKAFEHKPPDMLKERVHKDYASQLQNVLTSVKGVNKTNVMTLSTNFGSFKNLAHATPEQLALCPGLGDIKVRRLFDAFNLPFRVGASGRASKPKATTKPITNVPQNTPAKGKEKAPVNARPGVSHSTPRPDEQLTLSDVGLDMGLDDNDSRAKKRKRPSNEVVVIDDDEEDIGVKDTSIAGHMVEGSPDWPEMGSDNGDENSGNAKKVWKDPLSLSDDDD